MLVLPHDLAVENCWYFIEGMFANKRWKEDEASQKKSLEAIAVWTCLNLSLAHSIVLVCFQFFVSKVQQNGDCVDKPD